MAGTVLADTLQDGAGNSTTMTNAIQGSAKAWVQFNGSTSAINGSYNVSSITHSSTGIWLVNFTNAMTDANYTPVISMQYAGFFGINATAPTASAFNYTTGNSAVSLFDPTWTAVAIFR